MELVVIVFLIGVVIFSLYMYKKTSQVQSGKTTKSCKEKSFWGLVHVKGLNAEEKSPCVVTVDSQGVSIACQSKEYRLPIQRILYAECLTDVENIQYLKSSVAKGMIGAALFGVGGAVIGSAPKTKVRKQITSHAIIGYRDSSGKERVIILKDAAPNRMDASNLVFELNARVPKQIEKITL